MGARGKDWAFPVMRGLKHSENSSQHLLLPKQPPGAMEERERWGTAANPDKWMKIRRGDHFSLWHFSLASVVVSEPASRSTSVPSYPSTSEPIPCTSHSQLLLRQQDGDCLCWVLAAPSSEQPTSPPSADFQWLGGNPA